MIHQSSNHREDSSTDFAIRGALRESYYRAGYWSDEDFWTSFERVAKQHANRVALIDGERQITFAALAGQAAIFGTAARNAGLQPGEIVIIHGRHCIEAVVAVLGCAHAGMIAALLPPCSRPSRFAELSRTPAAG